MGIEIYHPDSPYLRLIEDLELWYRNLPEQFRIADLNIYIQKELHILGPVFALHFLYHAAVFDLTRISLPGFSFPLSSAFRKAPPAFNQQVQQRCRFHSDEFSEVIRKGFTNGRACFDDVFFLDGVFEATKIQIIHSATTSASSPGQEQAARENIRVNLQVMDAFRAKRDGPNNLVSKPYGQRLGITVLNCVASRTIAATPTIWI